MGGRGVEGPTWCSLEDGGVGGKGREAVSLAVFCLRLPAPVWLRLSRLVHLFSLSGESHRTVCPVSPPSVLGVDNILTSPSVSPACPHRAPAPQTAVQSLQDPGGDDGVTHAVAGPRGTSVCG